MKKASLLIQEIQTHKYNSIFKDVYVDEHLLSYQKERYVQAIEKFISLYGDQEVEIYSTPLLWLLQLKRQLRCCLMTMIFKV